MDNDGQTLNIEEILTHLKNIDCLSMPFSKIALCIINIFIDRGIGDNSSVYLKDEDSNTLFLVAARDKQRRAFTADNIKLYSGAKFLPFKWYFKEGEGIAGFVHLNKKPVFIDNVNENKRFVGPAGNKKQLLVIPLIIGNQSIGVINITSCDNKMANEHLRQNLIDLSAYFALLIQYSKLYSKNLTTNFLFSALMHYTDKTVILLDKEEKIISINPGENERTITDPEKMPGLAITSFYPKEEKKLRQYLEKLFGEGSNMEDRVIANRGTLSQISFDDLDNKLVIKAVKELPDNTLHLFDIIRLKVKNSNEEHIGSIEIWTKNENIHESAKSQLPVVNSYKVNKAISRLKLVKNELSGNKFNKDSLINHLDLISSDLGEVVSRSDFNSVEALIGNAFKLYNDYNDVFIEVSLSISPQISIDHPPYKLIQLFYLLLNIIVHFGNPSKPVEINGKIREIDGKQEIILLFSNDDLLIPKYFMDDFDIRYYELSRLLSEMNFEIDILKDDRSNIISLKIRPEDKTVSKKHTKSL